MREGSSSPSCMASWVNSRVTTLGTRAMRASTLGALV